MYANIYISAYVSVLAGLLWSTYATLQEKLVSHGLYELAVNQFADTFLRAALSSFPVVLLLALILSRRASSPWMDRFSRFLAAAILSSGAVYVAACIVIGRIISFRDPVLDQARFRVMVLPGMAVALFVFWRAVPLLASLYRRVHSSCTNRPASLAVIPLAVLLVIPLSVKVRFALRGCSGPNIVLVSIDTLRPDHLGCYGYHRETSRELDRLSEEAVLFTNAYSQSPWTLPAHFSLFTAQYPTSHGMVSNRSLYEPFRGVLAAQYFRDRGYRTAAFTNGGFVNGRYGFRLGFEIYRNDVKRLDDERVFRWIDSHLTEPFFLFLHTYRVHNYILHPEDDDFFRDEKSGDWHGPHGFDILKEYRGKEIDFTEEERLGLVDLYDAAVFRTDRDVGNLLDKLRESGIYDSTILIVTSDHGEEFGEHRHLYHGDKLFNEQVRVPLVIRFPEESLRSIRVDEAVELIDVVPTVIDYLELPAGGTFTGMSLMEIIRGKGKSRQPVFSTAHHLTSFSVIRGGWKYIVYGNNVKDPSMRNTESLYRLGDGERELYDLAAAYPETVLALRSDLEAIRDSTLTRPPSIGTIGVLSERLEQELKALGYLE